ncbi:NUDIX domain-containing protein [Patescibacteria group bacterium]|nr:NUDIX domain-containing protein [Patescibacteria group bacterium]
MKEFPNKNWSGGFLYNSKTKSVLLHKRDGNTKFNPNKWAFFGGLAEGNETPEQCLVRELKEELNFEVTPDELIPVCDYLNKELNTYRYVFCIPSEIEKTKLVLGEGAGFDWIPLDKLDDYELTEKTIKDLNTFIEKLI